MAAQWFRSPYISDEIDQKHQNFDFGVRGGHEKAYWFGAWRPSGKTKFEMGDTWQERQLCDPTTLFEWVGDYEMRDSGEEGKGENEFVAEIWDGKRTEDSDGKGTRLDSGAGAYGKGTGYPNS